MQVRKEGIRRGRWSLRKRATQLPDPYHYSTLIFDQPSNMSTNTKTIAIVGVTGNQVYNYLRLSPQHCIDRPRAPP